MRQQGRTWFLLALVALSAPVRAADIEPGNWEFTVEVTGEGLGALGPKPITAVNQRCISAEEARNPARVMGEAGGGAQCQFANQRDTGSQFTFDLRCSGAIPVRGSGSMRYTSRSLDGRLDLDGEAQGMRFSTRSHISARRLGPCNS